MSVADVLARSAGAPDAVALVGPERAWSYAELSETVDARVEALRGAGDAPAPVVPFVARGDVASIVELVALWRAGAVPAPLNARLTEPEGATARAALTDAVLPGGTQVVLWTSGTSGAPRGVALSMENLRAITTASAERLGLGPGDAWLASLSPAHVGGLVLIVRSLLLGGTLLAPGALDADAMASMLRGARAPSHLSLVPTQLHRLLDAWGPGPAPAALRCVLIGGAHAPASLVERASRAGWPIALTYGATEMSSQIATAPPDLVRTLPGSVGEPMPGVELRIADSGEIECRGATRALGYVQAPGRGGVDGSAGRPPGAALADADGWYRTGDLGRLDDSGRLWITGRRIDRIVSGGVTIDAVEVEEALLAHPSVADACVAGVPDPEWGERVGACVVPVEGVFDPDTMTEHLRGVLMAAKVPRVWYLTDEIPRNANGKTDRSAVRALLSSAGSPLRP